MTHLLRFFMIASFLLASLTGCGGDDNPVSLPDEPQHPRLSVSGSGSTSKLLKRLVDDGAVDASMLTFLEGSESGAGIAAVRARVIDVGGVSRAPKPGELGPGMIYQPFTTDGLAFVGKDGGVSSLTRKQLRDAFAGKVTNWREFGGKNLPIVLLVRDEGESVTQVLRRSLFGETFRFAPNATVLSSVGDMNEALLRTRGALGFTSHGSLSSTEGLTPLAVEGTAPSVETLEGGDYPFTRELGVVVRKRPATAELLLVLKSRKVADHLRGLGYAPLG